MQQLEKYEFLNPDAQRKYLELLNQLRKAMTQTFFKDIENMVNKMSPGDIERMKDMLKDLNELLRKKAQGVDPDVLQSHFRDFMDKFGDMFGDQPPQSLDELLEQMGQQMAATQSLLNSLTPDQRAQLQSLLADRFGDPELEAEMQRLAQAMAAANPRAGRYRFGGQEDIDLEAAMRLMGDMRQLDELINQVQTAERSGDLDRIDRDLLKELLDDDAADNLDDLKKLLEALEAGPATSRPAGDKWELTPRGSRMIGQKALGEIYARLRRQSLGNHALPEEGPLRRTPRTNQAARVRRPVPPAHAAHHPQRHRPRRPAHAGAPPASGLRDLPLRAHHQHGHRHACGPLLVDGPARIFSGGQEGGAGAAQPHHVALSERLLLHHRLRRLCEAAETPRLPFLQWDEYVLGTNMQHALLLAERLLAKHNAGSKQIIMISDGEPTAHLENGQARFAYPPTTATYRATAAGREEMHAEVHRHQHLHAGCRLRTQSVHGRHRPHQWRPSVLYVAGEARRVHPRGLRAGQAQAAGAVDLAYAVFSLLYGTLYGTLEKSALGNSPHRRTRRGTRHLAADYRKLQSDRAH